MRISNCCGAPAMSNGDCDFEDFGICSDCKEHCEYIEEEEFNQLPENEFMQQIDVLLNKIRDNNNELLALAATLNEENKATYSKKIAAIINETLSIIKTPQANGA